MNGVVCLQEAMQTRTDIGGFQPKGDGQKGIAKISSRFVVTAVITMLHFMTFSRFVTF